MRITQAVQKTTLEESIDESIDKVKSMKEQGITSEEDIFVLDLCLQYIILMSDIRKGS